MLFFTGDKLFEHVSLSVRLTWFRSVALTLAVHSVNFRLKRDTAYHVCHDNMIICTR